LTAAHALFKLCLNNLKTGEKFMAQVEAVLDLKQWGNNLGVRLPVNVARAAHLHVDQRVQVAVEDDGRVVITPIDDTQLTLAQRLARFDPARHGSEIMATNELLGAEKW
jgi:antitoxin MazE